MDAEEFDRFYSASFQRVVGQVHAMVGDRDEAQEFVQEAFARAWSHRRQLHDARSWEAWVRTTAYRLERDRLSASSSRTDGCAAFSMVGGPAR